MRIITGKETKKISLSEVRLGEHYVVGKVKSAFDTFIIVGHGFNTGKYNILCTNGMHYGNGYLEPGVNESTIKDWLSNSVDEAHAFLTAKEAFKWLAK